MLNALYQDEEILVIDKPAGLASQPGAGVGMSLVEAVERDFGFRPFLVHRLDKETAGCILVARSSKAAGRWTELIAGRAARKLYRALVAGRPAGQAGSFRSAVPVRGEEKSAETGWRLLGSFSGPASPRAEGEGPAESLVFSYLELELGTGRTHQIRLHLAQAGLPILGDDLHGNFRLNKRLKKDYGLKRLLLLAYRLELPGGRVMLASIPDYFGAFLASFPGAPPPETP